MKNKNQKKQKSMQKKLNPLLLERVFLRKNEKKLKVFSL